jgi:hypothetical protein
MYRLPYFILLALLFTSCAGNNFDEATIPTDQLSAEMAFKRMATHGGMEPVLEDNTSFKNWQFHISSSSRTVVMNSEPEFTYWLKDRSGIEYKVSSKSTELSLIEQMKGTNYGYGYGSGEITAVKRDLVAGKIEAELTITSWRER